MSDPTPLTPPNSEPPPPKLSKGVRAADARYGSLLTAILLAFSLMGVAVFLKTRELRSPDFLG